MEILGCEREGSGKMGEDWDPKLGWKSDAWALGEFLRPREVLGGSDPGRKEGRFLVSDFLDQFLQVPPLTLARGPPLPPSQNSPCS